MAPPVLWYFSWVPGAAIPGASRPGEPPDPSYPPAPPASLSYFSDVPGMAVPGMVNPGRDGQFTSAGLYLYIGHAACFYLDYLDLATGRTLAPVPGNFYSMAVANTRHGLTVPPLARPWIPGNPGPGGGFAPLFTRPAAVSHGHYPGAVCAHCDPSARWRPPRPRPAAGPPVPPPAVPPARPPRPLPVSHGHYPGAPCGHCDPASRRRPLPARPPGPPPAHAPVPLAESRAALERQRTASGWYREPPAPQPQPAPAAPPPPPPGPTVMQATRAALEKSRTAHGHYAPGGCTRCMSGG
jgi:hypothetical protein